MRQLLVSLLLDRPRSRRTLQGGGMVELLSQWQLLLSLLLDRPRSRRGAGLASRVSGVPAARFPREARAEEKCQWCVYLTTMSTPSGSILEVV
jgi:hypothetical protein